jgi:hypothetical protein
MELSLGLPVIHISQLEVVIQDSVLVLESQFPPPFLPRVFCSSEREVGSEGSHVSLSLTQTVSIDAQPYNLEVISQVPSDCFARFWLCGIDSKVPHFVENKVRGLGGLRN